MKKILFTTLLCVMNILFVIAQGTAQITFEKLHTTLALSLKAVRK